MSGSFLILHGLGGSGPDHWQTWLYGELAHSGEQVYYPDLPDPDQPDKDVWLKKLAETLAAIPQDEELTVIAHSLGVILWFHYAADNPGRRPQRAILVCPPSPGTELAEVSTFFPLPDGLSQVAAAAGKTLIVQSSNDPYCTLTDSLAYQSLGVPHLTLPDMGHINVASGHGPWKWILDVCRNGAAGLL